jgi:histidinol-phosphate aminotransferase
LASAPSSPAPASAVRIVPHIQALPATVPFVAPDALERKGGQPFRARLGANESAFGPSPNVLAAMRSAAGEVWKYGDPENHDLKAAIARHHGVAPGNVGIGEGIDGLLGLAARLTLAPGAVAVTSDGGYPTFNYHAAGCGGQLVKVPFDRDREDLGALLDAARRHGAAVLFVSNPNSPMGTWWNAGEIVRLIEKLPPGILLLLDEAYSDTAPAEALAPLDIEHPQVLRFRTFSKAYGLAGARVGYVLGETGLIQSFDKIRNHFGVNRIAQAAALAAIADQSYLAEAVGRIALAKRRLVSVALVNGLTPLPSGTNFVTMDCGRDGAFAQRLLDGLTGRGVFVRKPMVPPMDRCIRVSCGPDADIDVFAAELAEELSQPRK